MISIIVPVYNVERWLTECVDSIIAQTYKNWELILVDDGSTDSSGEICDRYAAIDRRIRVVHVENGGLSYARNIGIKESKGEKIVFIDSDDFVSPMLLERLTSVDADVVCCRFIRDGKPQFSISSVGTEKFLNSRDAVSDGLYQHVVPTSSCGVLYKSEIFRDLGFAEGLYYEDLEIFPKIMSRIDRLAVLTDKLYYYRKTPGSIVNVWNDRRLDVLKVTESIEKMFAGDADLSKAARSRRFSANYNMLLLSLKHGRNDIAICCYDYIKSVRRQMLTDRNVRVKNKMGALLSYAGIEVMKFISRL